ncbi:unnamed protein product [Protopolystoma xenopodis]|uniref:Uncharacterized protein n=1 Tax=Protopolystoma xenopodis TaxID=117903 RepID=A0A448XRJ2_9PLAT|nr:unnamed protein product [Protopolystoma xenopodis]
MMSNEAEENVEVMEPEMEKCDRSSTESEVASAEEATETTEQETEETCSTGSGEEVAESVDKVETDSPAARADGEDQPSGEGEPTGKEEEEKKEAPDDGGGDTQEDDEAIVQEGMFYRALLSLPSRRHASFHF